MTRGEIYGTASDRSLTGSAHGGQSAASSFGVISYRDVGAWTYPVNDMKVGCMCMMGIWPVSESDHVIDVPKWLCVMITARSAFKASTVATGYPVYLR